MAVAANQHGAFFVLVLARGRGGGKTAGHLGSQLGQQQESQAGAAAQLLGMPELLTANQFSAAIGCHPRSLTHMRSLVSCSALGAGARGALPGDGGRALPQLSVFLGESSSCPLPWGNPHSLQMPLCPLDLPQDTPSKCGADGAPSSPFLHLPL